MNKITYTSAFNDAIQLALNNELFLGLGNPNAPILILGKEAAIDKNTNPEHYKKEVVENAKDWEKNKSLNKQFVDVINWFTNHEVSKYNPLYPYKGQLNKVESRDKNGNIIRGRSGTSKTWYNYQKISDCLFNNGKSSNYINLQEHFFISELNQETAKYSKLIAKEKREESITNRKALFKKSFFKQFPITIVAVGHYVRDFNINLEELFEVQYDSEKSKLHTENLKNEFINIHFDSLDHPTRLHIHTNQLSMVSNELVIRLGAICKTFLNQK